MNSLLLVDNVISLGSNMPFEQFTCPRGCIWNVEEKSCNRIFLQSQFGNKEEIFFAVGQPA